MKVIVDTDLALGEPESEIDDGLALAMVVADPVFDLQAVTTVSGNVHAIRAAKLSADLLDRLGVKNVPVFSGATSALCDPKPPGAAEGGLRTHAAVELVRRVMAAPGQITVIAIGPLTNLAIAINLDPGFASSVKEIVVMGGTYFRDLSWGSLPGEFNFWLDPEAVRVVLSSGAAVRLVGLDVTTQVQVGRDEARRLRANGEAFAVYVGERMEAWINRLSRDYPDDPTLNDSCSLHDPVAVAAVSRPEYLQWVRAHVEIVTDDRGGKGAVVVERSDSSSQLAANCAIAADVDAESVRAYVRAMLEEAATRSRP